MDAALFDRFRKIAYDTAGINLGDGKEALVAARVAKRQRQLGMPDERQYLRFLEHDESGDELVQFLDAISTNFTSFFREPDHFDFLTKVVRSASDTGKRRLRIWCAASSSGEEPYSIAIAMLEATERRDLDIRILATDISTKVLAQAQRGVYDSSRLSSVSFSQRERYFTSVEGERGNFAISPELAGMITFRRLNLSRTPYPMQGPFDVVFCRNVMMYFDRPVRQRLVTEIERLLRPGGHLITGHAETLTGLKTALALHRPSIYRRPESSGSEA